MKGIVSQGQAPSFRVLNTKSAGRLRLMPGIPVPVALLAALLDPVIAVVSMLLIMAVYGVEFDGAYKVFVVLLFLIGCIVFTPADLHRAPIRWTWGRSTLVSWLVLIGVLLFLGYAVKYSEYFSRRVLLTWIVVAPLLSLIGHKVAHALVLRFYQSADNIRSAVVVVANDTGRRLGQQIIDNPRLGMALKGYFDDRPVEQIGDLGQAPLLGGLADLPRYVAENRVEVIYVALPMMQEHRILDLMESLRDTTVSVYFVPDIFVFDLIQARVSEVNGIPVLAVCETPFHGFDGIAKRLTDVVVASLALLLLSPLMLAIALGVKLGSPGPVIFKQRRYGLDGEEIIVYKFRSMTVCEDGSHIAQATREDRRVTPIGAFLRRTSLDELPQFINVLQGRMSVVGPRPHAVAHNEMYRKLIKGYMIRHKVKPGITGWAQVNGLRGETDSIEKMKARIEHDLDYLRYWSMALDVRIILKTILVVLARHNAY